MLTFKELFRYAPNVHRLYKYCKIKYSCPNTCKQISATATVSPNQVTPTIDNQFLYKNPETQLNTTIANQQNAQKNVTAQPPNNPKVNLTGNSMLTNNAATMQKPRTYVQQQPQGSYSDVRQTANVAAVHNDPSQHRSFSSAGTNESGKKYVAVQATSGTNVNQELVAQNIYAPQLMQRLQSVIIQQNMQTPFTNALNPVVKQTAVHTDPSQHHSFPSAGTNESGKKYVAVQATSGTNVNQQLSMQNMFTSQLQQYVYGFNMQQNMQTPYTNALNIPMLPVDQQYHNLVQKQPIHNVQQGARSQSVQQYVQNKTNSIANKLQVARSISQPVPQNVSQQTKQAKVLSSQQVTHQSYVPGQVVSSQQIQNRAPGQVLSSQQIPYGSYVPEQLLFSQQVPYGSYVPGQVLSSQQILNRNRAPEHKVVFLQQINKNDLPGVSSQQISHGSYVPGQILSSQQIPYGSYVPRQVQFLQQIPNQTYVPRKVVPSQQILNRAPVKQVWMDTVTQRFDSLLKHMSEIQKMIMLQHLNFYFSCTSWLQEPYSIEESQLIDHQRCMLLRLQTILTHSLQEIISKKSEVEDSAETKMMPNVKIDIPINIVVTTNETRHQIEREHKTDDKMQDKELSEEIRQSGKDEVKKDKTLGKAIQDNLSMETSSEISTPVSNLQSLENTNNINIKEESLQLKETGRNISSMNNKETKEQDLHKLKEMAENVSPLTFETNNEEQNPNNLKQVVTSITVVIEEKTTEQNLDKLDEMIKKVSPLLEEETKERNADKEDEIVANVSLPRHEGKTKEQNSNNFSEMDILPRIGEKSKEQDLGELNEMVENVSLQRLKAKKTNSNKLDEVVTNITPMIEEKTTEENLNKPDGMTTNVFPLLEEKTEEQNAVKGDEIVANVSPPRLEGKTTEQDSNKPNEIVGNVLSPRVKEGTTEQNLDKLIEVDRNSSSMLEVDIKEDNLNLNDPSFSNKTVMKLEEEIEKQNSDKLIEEDKNIFIVFGKETKEEDLDEQKQMVRKFSPMVEEEEKSSNEDPSHQWNPQLVTVEISSDSDQVTVIDSNVLNEFESTNEEIELHEELQKNKLKRFKTSEDSDCEISSISSQKTHREYDDKEIDDSSSSSFCNILDVRSISEAQYEDIENNYCIRINTPNKNLESEITCLVCGNPCTVVCSRCLDLKYCSKDCFELHWRESHHRDCREAKHPSFLDFFLFK